MSQVSTLVQPLMGIMAQRAARESDFKKWYAHYSKLTGLNPNPDAPEHGYDYRAAFDAGAIPKYVSNTDIPGWYWPSQFKTESNPRRLLSKNKNGAAVWGGSGPAYDTLNNQELTEDEAKNLK